MKKQTLIILSIIIFISLVVSYKLFNQNNEDIKSVLSSKDFMKFESFIKKMPEEEYLQRKWEYYRDITKEFQEGVFVFNRYIKDQKGKITSSYEVFQIKIITKKNNIIYYELNIQQNKKVKYEWSDSYSWEPYYILIEKFINEAEIKILKESFKDIFNAELIENELFKTDYVYGENCGAGAMNSRERMQLNKFISEQNKDSIIRFIKSTSTEKQIYGVEGILKLKDYKIKLSKAELEILKYIINKNGTIKVCNGCIYSNKEIKEVIKQINI